jgi:integrase
MFKFTLLKPLCMAFENLNLTKTKPKKKQYKYTGVQSADYFKKDDLISLGKELLQSEEHKTRVLGLVMIIGVTTGLRIQDILNLTSKNFGSSPEHPQTLYIPKQIKTKKPYFSPLSSSVWTLILSYLEQVPYKERKGENRLFLNEDTDKHYSIQWINRKFKAFKEDYSFLRQKNFTTHSLRKTHAYAVYELYHYDLMKVKEVLQHRSVASTQHYLKLDEAEREQIRSNVMNSLFNELV